MCKATKKADAYSITKDKKTGAFNISFNGVYSNDVRNLMYKSGFRWSKSNSCFYGWTKDIQSLSIEIQKLVYEWRNLKNKAGSIEVPVIFEKDIETVEIYQNKKDYVMACKARDEAVIKVSSLDDIIDELPFDPAPEVIESLTEKQVTEAITGLDKEEIKNKEEVTLSTSVKSWYSKEYPNDNLKSGLNKNVSFMRILGTLEAGEDVYDVLGEADSVIRERVFTKLAELLNLDYEAIYNLWIDHASHTYIEKGCLCFDKLPDGWQKIQGATTAPEGYYWASNKKSFFAGNRITALIKEGEEPIKETKKYSHGYNVGDVLYASWGYDQTNLDFFIITEATEKSIRIKECTMQKTYESSEGYSSMARMIAYDPKTAKPIDGDSFWIKDQQGRGDLKRICSYEYNGQKNTYINFRHGHHLSKYEGRQLYESWYA